VACSSNIWLHVFELRASFHNAKTVINLVEILWKANQVFNTSYIAIHFEPHDWSKGIQIMLRMALHKNFARFMTVLAIGASWNQAPHDKTSLKMYRYLLFLFFFLHAWITHTHTLAIKCFILSSFETDLYYTYAWQNVYLGIRLFYSTFKPSFDHPPTKYVFNDFYKYIGKDCILHHTNHHTYRKLHEFLQRYDTPLSAPKRGGGR